MIYNKSIQTLEIKDQDEVKRRIRFIATTFEIDREGDILHIVATKRGQGLMIPRGDKTPLKTFHDYHSYPIGFARDWELSSRKAIYTAEFFKPEISTEAEQAYRIAQTGALSNSIGFIDQISDRRELTDDEKAMRQSGKRVMEGMEFFEVELLEVSMTDVPANRSAVAIGHDVEGMVKKALADMVQAGGGCARKGCHSQAPIPLAQRIKDLEMEIIAAINKGDMTVDRAAIESLTGHLQDLDLILWAKAEKPEYAELMVKMSEDIKGMTDSLVKPESEEGKKE